jgi:hypothetical protein
MCSEIGWMQSRLVVRDGEQLIHDVGDPDIARPTGFDRIRVPRPHLRVRVPGEQTLLDLGREPRVLAALDGHDLLPAEVTCCADERKANRRGRDPLGAAFGDNAGRVANKAHDTVSRTDLTEDTVKTIRVGRGPFAISFGLGSAGVTNSADNTVTRLDGRTVQEIAPWAFLGT